MSVGTIYKNVECDPAKSSCGVGQWYDSLHRPKLTVIITSA